MKERGEGLIGFALFVLKPSEVSLYSDWLNTGLFSPEVVTLSRLFPVKSLEQKILSVCVKVSVGHTRFHIDALISNLNQSQFLDVFRQLGKGFVTSHSLFVLMMELKYNNYLIWKNLFSDWAPLQFRREEGPNFSVGP